MKIAFVLVVFLTAIAVLLRIDIKRRAGISAACWLPFFWAIIVGSRPVSTWFGYTPAGGADPYVEGNPVERNVFLFLILWGALVLVRRGINWRAWAAANIWLCVYVFYCALSVTWADDWFVAFKRFFKDFGNVVMALVILSEANPLEAIKATFVRCSYLLVLLSVLFIKYLTNLGRTFSGYNSSDQMFIGVCTHKNTLGCLLIVCCTFLVWDMLGILRQRASGDLKPGKSLLVGHGVVIAMALWLLSIINSATALVCSVLSIALILAARLPAIRKRASNFGLYLLGFGAVAGVLNSIFDLKSAVLQLLGRDASLTGRTDAWTLVLDFVDSPILGAGFKSFWSGDRMRTIWESFQGVVQAHNGYVETFLNGGAVGLSLLLIWLLSSYHKMKRTFINNPDFGAIRLTILLIIFIYNYSEAAFNQVNILWFAFLVMATECAPDPVPVVEAYAASPAFPEYSTQT